MANQPEVVQYDSGVYQIETTDPVDGGVGAVTNRPLLSLSNRTAWLKKHVDDLESGNFLIDAYAPKASPALTGSPTAPTQAAGDNSTKIATDAFVQTAVNGLVSVNVAGGATTTLTQAQYGVAIIVLTGAVTANKAVVFPAQSGTWLVINNTTGAFTITLKTASGTGVVVSRLTSTLVYGDGTNISLQQTDFISPALTGTPTTPTPASGDSSTKVASTAFVVGALADVGLGLAGNGPLLTDANALTVTSIYKTGSTWTGSPYVGTNGDNQGSLLHITTFESALYATQLFQRMQANVLLVRCKNNGVWGGWDSVATTNSPTLTGTPTAPTAATADNSSQLATTAFVKNQAYAPLASPALTGTPTAPTAAQFATGGQLITADALKARGNEFAGFASLTSSTTLTVAHVGKVVLVGGVGGAVITLPNASTVPAGGSITIQSITSSGATNSVSRSGTNVITGVLTGTSTQTTSFTLSFGDTVTLVSDGSAAWYASSNSSSNFVAAQFLKSQQFSTNGYQVMPGGMILQWGTTSGVGQASNTVGPTRDVTLPIAFPNTCQSVIACMRFTTMTTTSSYAPGAVPISSSVIRVQNNYTSSDGDISWWAVGN